MSTRFHKKLFIVGGVACLVTLFVLGLTIWAFVRPPSRTPQEALQKFYTYGDNFPDEVAAEDMLMDPLILAGETVVPLVIREIENPKMPRRRYAIGFLGNGSYKRALLVLEQILKDSSEVSFFRSDALKAIFFIDEVLGRKYARDYSDDKTFLGKMANDIINGRVSKELQHRSYFDALLGRQD